MRVRVDALRTQRVSNREYKEGKRVPPLPEANGALAGLPTSLESLSLGSMTLKAADLDMAPEFPSLRSLKLASCGTQALALAESLLSRDSPTRAPKLLRKNCRVGESAYSLKSLCPEQVKKDEAEEAERANRFRPGAFASTVAGAPGTSAQGEGLEDPMDTTGDDAAANDDESMAMQTQGTSGLGANVDFAFAGAKRS